MESNPITKNPFIDSINETKSMDTIIRQWAQLGVDDINLELVKKLFKVKDPKFIKEIFNKILDYEKSENDEDDYNERLINLFTSILSWINDAGHDENVIDLEIFHLPLNIYFSRFDINIDRIIYAYFTNNKCILETLITLIHDALSGTDKDHAIEFINYIFKHSSLDKKPVAYELWEDNRFANLGEEVKSIFLEEFKQLALDDMSKSNPTLNEKSEIDFCNKICVKLKQKTKNRFLTDEDIVEVTILNQKSIQQQGLGEMRFHIFIECFLNLPKFIARKDGSSSVDELQNLCKLKRFSGITKRFNYLYEIHSEISDRKIIRDFYRAFELQYNHETCQVYKDVLLYLIVLDGEIVSNYRNREPESCIKLFSELVNDYHKIKEEALGPFGIFGLFSSITCETPVQPLVTMELLEAAYYYNNVDVINYLEKEFNLSFDNNADNFSKFKGK